MKSKRKLRFFPLIKYILLTLFLWFLIHNLYLLVDGLSDRIATVNLGVVLGNKVELSGEPSLRLKARLDKALELYEEGYLENILVSGGVGVEGFDEALVMKDYLVNKGVPEEHVFVDSHGNNTYLTAKHTKALMEEMGYDTVMIISQYYHITRTKLAFSKFGMKGAYSAHGDFFEWRDGYSILREFVGYYVYWIRY